MNIQSLIDATPERGTVNLPNGIHTIDKPIIVDKPIMIRGCRTRPGGRKLKIVDTNVDAPSRE